MSTPPSLDELKQSLQRIAEEISSIIDRHVELAKRTDIKQVSKACIKNVSYLVEGMLYVNRALLNLEKKLKAQMVGGGL